MDKESSVVLGVMSDTHANLNLMFKVAENMRDCFRVEWIFHLGDNYRDSTELARKGYPVHQVPGLWCPEYAGGLVPKQLIVDVDGLAVACAHAEKDLRHCERAAAIVFTGHTHAARIELLGRTLYINPGHLTAPVNRGQQATFAIVSITADTVRAAIYDGVNFAQQEQTVVARSDLA